jgi:hypothetical protein
MKRSVISTALGGLLFFGITAFAQVGINASLSGTVSDATGALIPGVEVTATQTGTGVVSTALTNESGTYRFPSLQPGPYEVTASLAGFQTQTFRLTLGTAQQIVQNFALQVGAVTQAVEVTVAADQLLTAASASVGNVLPSTQVVDLPLVGRNVMDLVTATMPGVRGTGNPNTTFAGIHANGSANVGISMDGVTMNTGRHTQGLKTATFINPDMIDEMQVVVAPVDVEGRGAAQIQMRTRSGTNQYRGAATWNVRNSALNANSWANNRQRINPIWYNRHQYTASVGGPIIRNKTFFFGLFDRQDMAQKESVDAVVLTPLARQGIFRFFPGVNNGNADATPSGAGVTRVAPVVDRLGNPLEPGQIPGATGPLQSFSVFGDALNPGDPNRRRMDPTGFMARIIQNMPLPNAYDGATLIGTVPVDGLNTAVHRWVRRTVAGPAGGQGENMDAYQRQQFNIKIDHHFNTNHRLSGTWIRESHYTDNNALSPWPNGWGGEVREDPRVRTLQLTSTLSPTILNEFRYGYRITSLAFTPAIETPKYAEEAFDFLTKVNGYPIYQRPLLFNNHMIGASGDFGNTSPLTTFTDTLSWSRGSHALKFGGEFRYAHTSGWAAAGASSLIPTVTGGAGDVAVVGIDRVTGLLPNNITLAQNLLLSLSGSVQSISQKFETREPTDTRFLDYLETYAHADNAEGTRGRIRRNDQNEFNFFVKDDWKVTPGFTLNVGVRYDLFRVPFFLSAAGENWTRGLLGGNEAIFGYSGRTFAEAFHSGGGPQRGDLTQIVLIGKDTPYPKQGIWKSDKNNFSPAVGFAWSPGFWGKDKTTVRGGYQITHLLPGNSLSWIDADVGGFPGLEYTPVDLGTGAFRDFSNITIPVPIQLTPVSPLTIPLNNRSQALTIYAPDYTAPYVQTMTLGVTRSLKSNLILELRYAGTRGMRLHSTMNLNEADFRNNGLIGALETTRAGGDAAIFDQMLRGLNIGSGVVGTAVSGSEALRRHQSFRTLIANGDYAAVARLLNTTNIGTVQPAGQIIAGGTLRSSGLFPENFFVVNPQFSTVNYRNNSDSSKYHSLQTQLTMRATRGITYQMTHTWSRNLGVTGTTPDGGGINGDYRDLLNRNADYTVQAHHRTHDFRGHGTFQLPFGPGKWLGGGTSGIVARLIEGWQFGTIFNLSSGAPLNVVARNTISATGTPDIVGAFPREGEVVWDGVFGNFFSQRFQRVPDPACSRVAEVLRVWCTNTAIADANGNIVLQNTAPGQLGTLGLRPIYGPGSWDFDANIQKKILITESKQLTVRVDARNLFNHPTPGNPNLDINSGTFGEITTKTGNRSLAAQLRLEF